MNYALSIALLLSTATTSAFVAPRTPATRSSSSQEVLNMMVVDPSSFLDSSFLDSTSTFISTIDGDIAKISDNEFAPVFMGGIAVMFGGVLSAIVVGGILEKGDLYANVVADSYIQQEGNDEEFWKGLSEEERIKGQEILKQLQAKRNGEEVPAISMVGSDEGRGGEAVTEEDKPKKEMDMFSDYE